MSDATSPGGGACKPSLRDIHSNKAKTYRMGGITLRLPLLSLPKRLLFFDASLTLPARLREGDMMPVRCNALVALREGDLIMAIGLAAMLMLERRLRAVRERSPGAAPAWNDFDCGVVGMSGVGVMLSSRSMGSTGLGGTGSVCEGTIGIDGLVMQGARRPDEKKAE